MLYMSEFYTESKRGISPSQPEFSLQQVIYLAHLMIFAFANFHSYALFVHLIRLLKRV